MGSKSSSSMRKYKTKTLEELYIRTWLKQAKKMKIFDYEIKSVSSNFCFITSSIMDLLCVEKKILIVKTTSVIQYGT